MKKLTLLLIACILWTTNIAVSQDNPSGNGYIFTKKTEIGHTPVKDQYRSGTCWSFATVSFLESELLRIGKGQTDISEMYFVNHAYRDKANAFVRYHGKTNFGPGGQAHDVLNTIRNHGIATEAEYPGLITGETKHDHSEFDAVLEAYLKAVVDNKSGKISKVWNSAFSALVDSYLGPLPDKSADMADAGSKTASSSTMGLNPDDYVEISSYLHHPFYKSFVLEIPDNWSFGSYYNVPLDQLVEIMKYSLDKGFTIAWDGDVSDKGFSHSNGLALVPEIAPLSNDGTEMAKWEKMSDKEKNEFAFNFKEIRKEKQVTPEMRQDVFNNYQATDDHLMHIVGMVSDQNEKEYFIVKNSWSDKSNAFGGYLNMSEAYVRLNTIAIMVHKDAIPANIKKLLKL